MTAPTSWTRRRLLAASALLAVPGLSRAAGDIAGGKPITLVVSYPPGGGADVMARLIAPRLAQVLGQTVVVENKAGGGPGAGGVRRGDEGKRLRGGRAAPPRYSGRVTNRH